MENLAIIGSGPAGLTAAIYAARANLSPVVVEGVAPGGQLVQTFEIENFPGFPEPVSGQDLMDRMRLQAERLGVRFICDEVESPDFSSDVKKLPLAFSGETVECRAVIIATGASARYLGLPSESALRGHGVSGCATCDGAFYKGRDVAVVGGGDTALSDALYLSRICRSVTLIHRRDSFRAAKILSDRVAAAANITVKWCSVVDEVLGADVKKVTGLRLRDVRDGSTEEISVDGLFVAIGHTPNTSVFRGTVQLDAEGYIVAESGRTSVEGVFAAGDVQDPRYRQAVAAAGSGCIAALEAERYLAGVL